MLTQSKPRPNGGIQPRVYSLKELVNKNRGKRQ